jgi:hypothetical protein
LFQNATAKSPKVKTAIPTLDARTPRNAALNGHWRLEKESNDQTYLYCTREEGNA